MADFPQLSRLTRKADSVAESASALVRQTMREIRGELANLSGELNLAGSAEDREKVYTEIRRRMALLSRRMNTLMEAQNEGAAKGAAKSASALTGLEVKYSPSRAKAICELVTPAQGENLAAVFTDRMGRALINSLREATVGMLREQAVAGGSAKDMARDLAARWSKAADMEDPKFTDAGGRVWDTKTYIQMNVRTNTMRVYNDCLADNVARETGSDLMRISTGGDQDCDCAAWEGCIISLTGATKGLPTYDDARNGGCFHPNCTHTLEYVDEVVDAEEIELQKSIPADEGTADDYDAQDERKYQIDQARYMRDNPGMTQEQARVAVDRDNLAASIQSGLIRGDAREVVAKMTDEQVTALCPNGNPPAFEPVKRIPGGTRAEPNYEPEKWNHGSNGGVVHIARNASAEQILAVCKVKDANPPEEPPKPEPKKEEPTPEPPKSIEEIKAMEVMDAIREAERFSDHIANAPIPPTITAREDRLARMEEVYYSRYKARKEADNKIKRIDKAYWRETDYDKRMELRRQLNAAIAERSVLYKKCVRAWKLKDSIETKLFNESLPWAERFIVHSKTDCRINTASVSKALPRWRDAKTLLQRIVAPDVFPQDAISVKKLKDGSRAFCRAGAINLTASDKIPTFIHETMHFIEQYNPHVHKRCVDFLKKRTDGESPQLLRKVTGRDWYDATERTRKDKFFDPYCGKLYEYPNRDGTMNVSATEVLSMGVERLVQNPVRFLREDREYATMCLNLIWGNL